MSKVPVFMKKAVSAAARDANATLSSKDADAIAHNFGMSLASFTMFFNCQNGTDLKPSDVLNDADLMNLYDSTRVKFNKSACTARQNRMRNFGSTKKESYDALDVAEADQEVLDYIVSHPNSSRDEITAGIARLHQTTCGAVRRLLDRGLIEVAGSRFRQETNRNVETLKAVAVGA